jgi:hypothetical protein
MNAVHSGCFEMQSQRQDQISQQARDFLAAFFVGQGNDPLRVNVVEIQIDTDHLSKILDGGDGFIQHRLAQHQEYFQYYNDPRWAIIVEQDCDGDIERGKELFFKELRSRKPSENQD